MTYASDHIRSVRSYSFQARLLKLSTWVRISSRLPVFSKAVKPMSQYFAAKCIPFGDWPAHITGGRGCLTRPGLHQGILAPPNFPSKFTRPPKTGKGRGGGEG